jgi:hypothetical protein
MKGNSHYKKIKLYIYILWGRFLSMCLSQGIEKPTLFLQNPPFPPETFGNLLLLYCKPCHGFYDIAADVMAENADLIFKHLSQVCGFSS